ncbi:hypothetical protein EDL79_02080 [Ehrlichia ruminantium]|uniref:Uncharacterized protein n=1 Tax=Ehrlichia ruminantium TaxID=779 RepID=A0AAE6UKN6_EHRRU|nr:hypothetical protein [Ehrlichia ruminantium]QGR02454.1 hypothetical protein EDL81_02085 [Ehrlichia ruminantium]QGR03373.1 hypothetical protein EDL80_02080 [Ehrlichia ruminantium]QGR04300.1 hypothetical protein EDL79_02080 [Ehrlichia ruminantium]
MQHIVKKYKNFNYQKIHLITVVVLLAVSDIITIIKLTPYAYQPIKSLIPLCFATLSILFIALYSVYTFYNLNIIKKHIQNKTILSKKSIYSHIGFIGESASLLGLHITSAIAILALPINHNMLILGSIFGILSSLSATEYSIIALSTDIEKHQDLKKNNKPTKYTIWSIGNWTVGLVISLINIGVIISSYFIKHKSPEIFRVILLTTYVLIISSMLIMKNSQNNRLSLNLNTNIKMNNSITKDIQFAKLGKAHSV